MKAYLKVPLSLLLASFVLCSYEPITTDLEQRHRSKRDDNPSWKYTQFQINALQADMATYDLFFCGGNAFDGIQCPEEPLCAGWNEICDGQQKCALTYREHCLNQTRLSFGSVDVRICDGDENERWCGWRLQAPQRCGEDYYIKSGTGAVRVVKITSPNWPNRYTNDRFCYWTVEAPEGHKLSVRVRKFKTEKNFDYVSIGNGLRYDQESTVIVFRHSGREKPRQRKFNARGNKLWVTFRSDDWENERGFLIEVTDTIRYDAGQVGRNPFRGNKPNTDCGEDVTLEPNQAGRITSPGYPDSYPDNVECVWVIRMPLGRRMEIEFEVFELEEELDYISVGNGDNSQIRPLLYKYSGRTGPANQLSNGNVVWVKFFSSLAIARDGFVINFRDYPYRDCGEGVTVKTVTEGMSIAVASPNYPEAYDNNLNCIYRFQAEPGRRLLLRILDFRSERGYDWLGFGNGFVAEQQDAVLWGHSGPDLPDPVEFVSNSTEAWLLFRSDVVTGYKGFLAEVWDTEAR